MCVQETRGETPRAYAYDPALITVSNYLRVVAAVIMSDLVLCKNDETFFQGESRGSYTRTGAKEVVGLTLYQHQQLMRYLHLVNSDTRPGTETDDHDKCFYLLLATIDFATATGVCPMVHTWKKQRSRRGRRSVPLSVAASFQQRQTTQILYRITNGL